MPRSDERALPPVVLVFEKRPRRESELKRQLMPHRVPVRACRSAPDVIDQLEARPGSVLLLDLEAGAADCLRLIGAVLKNGLSAFPIVIGSPIMAELEWPARELGALDFVSETVGGEHLARICRRQLAAKGAEPEEDLLGSILALE